MLYIVPTPIGNLEDITYRAVRLLRDEVDLILCEDTRHSLRLLAHYDIHRPLQSFHAHSPQSRVAQIIAQLQAGTKIALISDAGTPGISDPGFILISQVVAAGLAVTALPGATAFATALSCSGLPTHTFRYIGFLPHKKGRQTLLRTIVEAVETVVFYESPYRLVSALEQLANLQCQKPLVVARELTKIHEEFVRGTAAQLLAHFTVHLPRGEFVVIVGPL